MTYIPEEPPDENEQFENLDEALDDEDVTGERRGSEGRRDIDEDLVVDEEELEELGANLDDPSRISMLDGAMDDPDGVGPPDDPADPEAGWDVDPVVRARQRGYESDVGADGDEVTENLLLDVPETEDDPELSLIDEDPDDLDEFPDDAPGPDSTRW